MVTKQLTREDIELQINADMDGELVKLLQAKPADRPKMLMEFEKKRIEAITLKVKSIKAESDQKQESEKKATDAFKTHATDVFIEAWKKVKDAAQGLEFVTGVSFSCRKSGDDMVFEEPTLILAGLKTIKSGATSDSATSDTSTRGKGLSGSKDGVEWSYPSASAAKVAHLEGKESSQMSRPASSIN